MAYDFGLTTAEASEPSTTVEQIREMCFRRMEQLKVESERNEKSAQMLAIQRAAIMAELRHLEQIASSCAPKVVNEYTAPVSGGVSMGSGPVMAMGNYRPFEG